MLTKEKTIFIDPPSKDYYQDRLFNINDKNLNRDRTLLPIFRLRSLLNKQGIKVRTADYLFNEISPVMVADYYSFGILSNYKKLKNFPNIRLRGFVIMEPPVTHPRIYRFLPEITKFFDQVFIHNVEGDGYSLKNVDRSKLRTLFWPQPYDNVIDQYWNNTLRENRIVAISSRHIPFSLSGELYGKRIEVMLNFAKSDKIDLFGKGWDKLWTYKSMWLPNLLNYKKLISIYRGPCESKHEVLSRYKFSLCFENMSMQGYISEKIFDCFYAGCIPIYLGAKNISKLIPTNTFIDCRKYSSAQKLLNHIMKLSDNEILLMKQAGKNFIKSLIFKKYFESLNSICE
jgi:alpha(1,3/1,4) fucosyltransferase